MRLTLATPAAHLDDTRNLAVALGWINGYTPAEWEQSFSAQYQDAAGNIYHISSFEASTDWIATATQNGPVERPTDDVGTLDEETGEYGAPYVVNLAGAHRAQERLVIWQPAQTDPETGEVPDNPVPQVGADKIVAIIGMKGPEALNAMGLQSIPMEM